MIKSLVKKADGWHCITMNRAMTSTHPLEPIFDSESRILILGSFPSSESRKQKFYYAHPRNRFWKVMAFLGKVQEPQDNEEKTRLLGSLHLALWDVVRTCKVTGSSDASITDVIPNDINTILKDTKIDKIVCNGNTSYNLYMKYLFQNIKIQPEKLPSTSPANAAWSLEQLIRQWKVSLCSD